MGWVQPYEQSMALCGYIGVKSWSLDDEPPEEIRRGHITPKKVEEYWHRTFNCVAEYLGFNKATRKILWEDLVMGNWEKLHQTDEECRKTPDEWLEKLEGEVWYCSDRWSLDRLTRCHWLWRQYELALWRQNESDLSEGGER
jgi:hypothetical protein